MGRSDQVLLERILRMAYEKLREMLLLESYPHVYSHKFIGHNSEAFAAALLALEEAFPRARRVLQRESGGARFLALTYEIHAESADEIITLISATATLTDLKIVL